MNYEPNTVQWRKGQIVIHDADAKTPEMLMRVTGWTRDGYCRTRYLDNTDKRIRGEMANAVKFLHDPRRFGIDVPTTAGETPTGEGR